MELSAATLFLDPLLPVSVRPAPSVLPLVQFPDTTTLLLICWSGRIDSPDAPAAPPFSAWRDPRGTTRLRSAEGWLIAIGHRLIREIGISCFGEPGFCRFLDDLLKPGWSPIGCDGRERIDAAARSLGLELAERPPAYRARARGLLSDLLLVLYRSTLSGTEPRAEEGYRLADALDYIESHYAEEISLASLAAIIGCSSSYFSRLFARVVGVPPLEYVNRVRIRRACELLRSTDEPVTSIAVEVGYNNLSFFNRYFRRIMLRTPREYRRYVAR